MKKSNKKVFCEKCKYYKWRLGSHYGLRIPGDILICAHKNNLKTVETPIEKYIKIIELKCEKLNKKNSCKNYKRKWWAIFSL